ncbi:hypothetical protein B0H14DRAFT_2783517 [Mycena olivaceomarginata]|nr:hypothetical protein B0H14DRAFT_2783517 [Mycena olivaceomarginata]
MSYHAAPPSPTSSASSFSSGPPQTPTSPNPRRLSDYQTSLPRQNTAERRASHNAVERARRETLNARSSCSAIVNSSIAHARATRRYRHLASQQLRALNAECDMVRREVNQWRARAGVHPAVAPARSEGFLLVLGGEEPAFDPVDLEGEDDEDADYRGVLSHRRPQPAEPVCEGPLLLSDPYARTSPPPTYDASAAAAAPASTYPTPSTQGYHGHPSPHSHSASPVAASLEVPNPYNGFLLQQQQGDEWAFAQGQCHPAWSVLLTTVTHCIGFSAFVSFHPV